MPKFPDPSKTCAPGATFCQEPKATGSYDMLKDLEDDMNIINNHAAGDIEARGLEKGPRSTYRTGQQKAY